MGYLAMAVCYFGLLGFPVGMKMQDLGFRTNPQSLSVRASSFGLRA